jgi:hypothetical protein
MRPVDNRSLVILNSRNINTTKPQPIRPASSIICAARGDKFSLHKKAEALDQSGVGRHGFSKILEKRAASAALLL